MYDEISGTWYNPFDYITKDFTQTETLHYQDGSSVVSREIIRNLEPARAVPVTHISPIGGRVEFWMDHDPRIVGVEYSYALA
jgi:hypothetical protein